MQVAEPEQTRLRLGHPYRVEDTMRMKSPGGAPIMGNARFSSGGTEPGERQLYRFSNLVRGSVVITDRFYNLLTSRQRLLTASKMPNNHADGVYYHKDARARHKCTAFFIKSSTFVTKIIHLFIRIQIDGL